MKKFLSKTLPVVLAILLSSCNSGASNGATGLLPQPTPGPTPAPSQANVVAITAGSGYNGNGLNVPYVTLTICQPGSNNCQTIDHILVDSGSTGLKINQSQLSGINLPPIDTNPGNAPIFACSLYGSGYTFASSNYADVKISGEVAANIPIQIINDNHDQSFVPASCSNQGQFNDFASEGAKGIIGINPNFLLNNDSNLTYSYANGSYNLITDLDSIPVAIGVNPVSQFATDNNGVIINLPSVAAPTNTNINGTLTFGIATQTNNVPPTSLSTTLGDPHNFTGMFTIINGSNTYNSMYDSGTNGYLFYDNQLPVCKEDQAYCPATPYSWQSSVYSYNNFTASFNLALQVITPPKGNYGLIPGIAWPSTPKSGLYGLPFFFGRSVYISYKNSTTAMGAGPAWGYVNN